MNTRLGLPVFVGLLALASLGCIPKHQPVVLDSARPVRVAFVFDHEEQPEVVGIPDALQNALMDVLSARNLVPRIVDPDEFGPEFARRRASPHRMEWLTEKASADDLVLLVETRAAYYSQISGRWRWTVSAKATIGTPGDAFPLDDSMEIPVFLQFGHEQEPEALDAARGVVAKRLGRLLDTALGGLNPEKTSAAPSAIPGRPTALGTNPSAVGPVYFLMVDRFANGDPSNDGDSDPIDPQGFHGGDLRGVIDHVDHLAELGVRTVWLSPVFAMRTEKHGPWGAYHGYWIEDPYRVEPRFGTEDDLRELADALHARDMKLVLDFVANHVGPGTAMTTEHPEWFHGRGDIIDWSDPVQATTHDVHGLPDLAQERQDVYDWLFGAAAWWITAVGVDGYRLDAVRHVPTEFWARFNDDVRGVGGDDFLLIGELFDGDPVAVSTAMREGRFGQMFDFPMYYAVTDVVCGGADPGRLGAILSLDRLYDDPSQLMVFADNHDLPRIATKCGGDLGRAGTALQLFRSLRGSVVWTWGTEWMPEADGEPDNRADAAWGSEPVVRLGSSGSASSSPLVEVGALTDDRIELVAADGSRWLLQDGRLTRTAASSDTPIVRGPGRVIIRSSGAPRGDLYVVGAGPELGNWAPERGVRIGESTLVEVPGSSVIEYKLVVRTDDGVLWEDRPNRYALVRGGETVEVEAVWGS